MASKSANTLGSAAGPGPGAPPLSEAELRLWSDFFGPVTGWIFGSSRAHVLGRVLAERASALGLADRQTYHQQLTSGRDLVELARLVELLVNKETSFFRNEHVFNAVEQRVAPELLARARQGRPVTVVSAGCSTGQEAYSLGLVLAHVWGDDPSPFAIWGGDISQTALTASRAGRYSSDDVSGVPRHYRGYLQATLEAKGLRYEVVSAIRQRTTFEWLNLMTHCANVPVADLIVCQNVLLYFSARAASQVLNALRSRLQPGGVLILGSGEAVSAKIDGMEPLAWPHVQAFRRQP